MNYRGHLCVLYNYCMKASSHSADKTSTFHFQRENISLNELQIKIKTYWSFYLLLLFLLSCKQCVIKAMILLFWHLKILACMHTWRFSCIHTLFLLSTYLQYFIFKVCPSNLLVSLCCCSSLLAYLFCFLLPIHLIYTSRK